MSGAIGSLRDADWSSGLSAGSDAFLTILNEVGKGAPAAATLYALSPTPAGPAARQGAVEGQAGLTYSYHPDETAVWIGRTGADGATPQAMLTRGEHGALLDHDGRTAGRFDPDGDVRLDPAWAPSQAAAMSLDAPAPARTGARADAETDRACKAPDEVADAASEQAENARLQPELRSTSADARNAAFDSDPQLRASGLQRSGPTQLPNDQCAVWNAHHLMSNAEVRGNQDLFKAAAEAGWSPDEKQNVIGLPKDRNAQEMLATAGSNRPIHDSPHQTKYKPEVEAAIEKVKRQLEASGLPEGSAAYNQQARALLEQQQDKLRSSVMSHGLGRLTEAEPSSDAQAA